MFDKQYRFKGKHALRVSTLIGVFDEVSKAKIFGRNVDVYADAPLIGFLYNRTAELDNTKNPETHEVYNQNVMGDRVMQSQDELTFNFRLIMLLDANYEPDVEKRINNAFKFMDKPEHMERFNSYVRGGVDVLYEKITENATTPDEYVNNLYDFLEEFEERFNQDINVENVLNACIN